MQSVDTDARTRVHATQSRKELQSDPHNRSRISHTSPAACKDHRQPDKAGVNLFTLDGWTAFWPRIACFHCLNECFKPMALYYQRLKYASFDSSFLCQSNLFLIQYPLFSTFLYLLWAYMLKHIIHIFQSANQCHLSQTSFFVYRHHELKLVFTYSAVMQFINTWIKTSLPFIAIIKISSMQLTAKQTMHLHSQ